MPASRLPPRCQPATASTTDSDLLEHDPIPGREEYLDSENTRSKVRDWDQPRQYQDLPSATSTAPPGNRRCRQTRQLRFLRSMTAMSSGFVKDSVDQPTPSPCNSAVARGARILASARRRPARDEQRSADTRRGARNLITGELYPVEWGGIRLRIDT